MKKFYKIIFLLIVLIFLSTFNPREFNLTSKKNDTFFKIQNIEINNNSLIKKSEIEKKLGDIYKKNIFFIRKQDIEKPLHEIDFLKKIEVKRRYPDTIIIKIFETKPIAILFRNEVKYLLDSSSNLVLFSENDNFNQLPSVFGQGAENNFVYFFKTTNFFFPNIFI